MMSGKMLTSHEKFDLQRKKIIRFHIVWATRNSCLWNKIPDRENISIAIHAAHAVFEKPLPSA
jgi:hypothetical protein